MVIVNARFLTQETSGVQRFAEQICLRLRELRDDLVFVAPPDIRQHTAARRLGVRRIGRHSGHLWEQVDLPLWLLRQGKPLLVSLCNTAPLAYRNQIATHHDITYLRHPESYSRRFVWLYRTLTPLLLKRVRYLMTVSDFSRREIARSYGFPLARIIVVKNAVSGDFTPAPAGHAPAAAKPYLLAVSSVNAHKNLHRMIDAFLGLDDVPEVELRIVGGAHAAFAAHRQQTDSPRVRWLGRLSDAELIEQYRGALGFVFPSLYEGFGIPPLEAQACGCPVLASWAASIPEVLGDSAAWFDPLDSADIARGMRQLVGDAQLRAELKARGTANAARYSWANSAEKVAQLIHITLTHGTGDRSEHFAPAGKVDSTQKP